MLIVRTESSSVSVARWFTGRVVFGGVTRGVSPLIREPGRLVILAGPDKALMGWEVAEVRLPMPGRRRCGVIFTAKFINERVVSRGPDITGARIQRLLCLIIGALRIHTRGPASIQPRLNFVLSPRLPHGRTIVQLSNKNGPDTRERENVPFKPEVCHCGRKLAPPPR